MTYLVGNEERKENVPYVYVHDVFNLSIRSLNMQSKNNSYFSTIMDFTITKLFYNNTIFIVIKTRCLIYLAITSEIHKYEPTVCFTRSVKVCSATLRYPRRILSKDYAKYAHVSSYMYALNVALSFADFKKWTNAKVKLNKLPHDLDNSNGSHLANWSQ